MDILMNALNYFGPVLRVLPDELFRTSLVNMAVVLLLEYKKSCGKFVNTLLFDSHRKM